MLILIFYFEVPLVIPVYKKEQKIFKIKFFIIFLKQTITIS